MASLLRFTVSSEQWERRGTIKGWGIGTTRTFRVHHALHECGIDYETEPVRTRTVDMDRPEFRTVAVSGKVPSFQDGDFVLNESAAITRYVMTRAIPPRPVRAQAVIDQWCYFMMMELDATSLYVVRRHEGLPDIYGESEIAVSASKSYFDRQLTTLCDELLDGRTYLNGTFSELDILLISMLDWAAFVKLDIPGPAEVYADKIRERPAYQAAYRHNYGNRTR